MYYQDDEDRDYQYWREHGHSRGWFDRVRDEVSSWFRGDDRVRQRGDERGYGFSSPWSGPDYVRQTPLYDHEPGQPYAPFGYQHEGNYGEMPQGRWQRRYEPNRSYDARYGRQTYGSYGPVENWTRTGASEYGGAENRMHAGRGPRNYQRSDERIHEDVVERLTRNPRLDASDIEVAVRSGEVTLSGMVEDRWQKRVALEEAEDVFGVKNVLNQLKVRQTQTLWGALTEPMREQGEEHQVRENQRTLGR